VQCKNRAKGWGLGRVGYFVKHMLNKLNKMPQILDFQRFEVLSKLLSMC